MRTKILLTLALCFGLGAPAVPAQLASPYSNSVFPAQIATATGWTSSTIQLNGLVVSSTVGSSFASGTITVTGTSLTTVTFAVMGSSDNGATYYALPVYVAASPTTTPTLTVTATANGLYQINLAGLTHIKFVTSGTFTATNVTLTLTASPNAMVSKGNGAGGSVTASAMQAAMYTQSGCTTAGYAWNPATNTCTAAGGGSPTGAAGGDLNGSNYPNPQVSGLKGVPFCAGFTPTNGQAVVYTTGGSPNPCYSAAASGASLTLTGDVTGTGAGSIATTVGKIKNVPLCTSFTPTNGQVLQYTTSSSPNPCYTAATQASGCTTGCAFTASTYNGVNLQTGGSSSQYLTAAGGYVSAGGVSTTIKFMSVQGCPQNADPNAGGGTDGTSCINALFAAATPANPITVWQDSGFTTVGTGGTGIKCPSAGNCTLRGNGGGIARTQITACTIAGGVAIFTTPANNLVAGETGTLANLVHCPTITNSTVTVLAAGLISTQFEVSAGGTVAPGAETGTFNQVYGTGFFLASGANDDLFANGAFSSGGVCYALPGGVPGFPTTQGSNIAIRDLVLNGNANGQSAYCFGIHLANVNGFLIDNVVLYNSAHFSLTCDNCSQGVIHGNKVFSSSTPIGTQTDGFHIDGPASDIAMSDNYIKTGDDGIALNAREGYCGPISRITIDNTTLDNAFSAIRMYNLDENTCPINGSIPLINMVDISNMNGTVAARPFIFGAGAAEQGTLNPAIDNIHMSNITLTSPTTTDSPFDVVDNIGEMSLSNFNLISPGYPQLMTFQSDCSLGAQHFQSLSISNMRVIDTPAGSAFQNFITPGCDASHFGGMTFGTLNVHGFGVTFQGGSYTPPSPLFPGPTAGGMKSLSMTDIDTTNIGAIFGTDVNSWLPSLLWNVFVLAPGGLVTSSLQTYGSSTVPSMSLSGQMSTPGGGVVGGSNCNFGGAISPWECGSVEVNGSLVYFPLQHP